MKQEVIDCIDIIDDVKSMFTYHEDILYKVSDSASSVCVNGMMCQPASRSIKHMYGTTYLEVCNKHFQIKDIVWMLHNGEIDESQMVDYIDPQLGAIISNLCIRPRYKDNILSETTNSGLSSIHFDSVNKVYYWAIRKKRVTASESSDWRITLNHKLTMTHKWLKPSMPYSNTPKEVWEYLSQLEPGYHKGAIEPNLVKIQHKPKSKNPKLAYFKADPAYDPHKDDTPFVTFNNPELDAWYNSIRGNNKY